MYQWNFLDNDFMDNVATEEAVNGFPGEVPADTLCFDTDWTAMAAAPNEDFFDGPGNGQPVEDVDAAMLSPGHETGHELLNREQEQQIAHELTGAFGQLQSLLARERKMLADVYEQICHEDYDSAPLDFDSIITLYDTLEVYEQLAHRSDRFEAEYFQVWQRLCHHLSEAPLNRDFVLSLTEKALNKHSRQAPDWQEDIERHKEKLFAVRNQFVSANIRLVYHVARQHMDKGMNLEDMVQEGVLGLMRAALKFDAGVGVRFSTYSFWWIKQAIKQAISRQRSLIRYPTHINDQVNKVYGFVQDELRRTGRKPTLKQIQKNTGFSRSKLKDLLALTNFCVSASATLYDDGDKTLMDDLSYQGKEWTPEEEASSDETKANLSQMLSVLNEREAMILSMKFGVGQRRAYSLNEIAPQVGVSRERVRQIIEEAITKIRERFPDAGSLSEQLLR